MRHLREFCKKWSETKWQSIFEICWHTFESIDLTKRLHWSENSHYSDISRKLLQSSSPFAWEVPVSFTRGQNLSTNDWQRTSNLSFPSMYSQVANRGWGQKFFQNPINGGVGNHTLKWKKLLWFIAKISLIRLVDE